MSLFQDRRHAGRVLAAALSQYRGGGNLVVLALPRGGVPVGYEVAKRQSVIDAVASKEREELARRERLYRGDRPPVEVGGRTVILVDDGLATGSTMRAAVAGLRARAPSRIVIGVPIADPSTCEELASAVDDIVCAVTPEPFYAVGAWYSDFSQTTDEEVRQLLEAAWREQAEREHAVAPETYPVGV